jgi:acyl-CoA synthetase (AMP-forming)/AMP-acid ligase II
MLPDILRERAASQPDGRAFTFLDSGEREGSRLTWASLEQRSRAIASAIRARVAPGARLLLLYPPGLEFVAAFFASLRSGTIAIAAYPPAGARADRTTARLRGIVLDAGVSLILAPASLARRREVLETSVPELGRVAWLATDAIESDGGGSSDVSPQGNDIALLQYTSGSTSQPRGVMVTHANIVHNLSASAALAGHDRHSAAVSWLPVNHDMGLVEGILQPVFSGFPAWLMAPTAFLQRPGRWLQAISRVRATHSGAPDFAYALCVRRVTAEDRRGLDLSCWRNAFNGSEPVRQATLGAFHAAFSDSGFRSNAFRPAYGLAESTLLVSSQPRGHASIVVEMDAAALERGTVRNADARSARRAIVACGLADGPAEIAIVEPVRRIRSEPDTVGEIWVRSGSVAAGYWNRRDETASTFRARLADSGDGPFLRTGDLGFVRDGHLFVTGRLKDLIIVRGLKHYPQDLEQTAEEAAAMVRRGGCAAFALDTHGDERIALVAEVDLRSSARGHLSVLRDAIDAIRRAISDAHSLAPACVALVNAGVLPRTTSGKLQRYLCRDGLRAGALPVLAWWSEDEEVTRAVS